MRPMQPSPARRRKRDPVGDPAPEVPLGERNVMVWKTGPNGLEPHSAAENPTSAPAWPDSEKLE